MSKTVFFVTSHRAMELGGGERWNIKIARELVASGYRVGLVTTPDATIASAFAEFTDLIFTFPFKFDFNPSSISKMRRIFAANAADVVICNFNKDVSIGGIAARRAGVKTVLFRNGYPILQQKFKHKLLLPFFDRIITNSQLIVDRYSSYNWGLENKMELIYNGIAVAASPPPIKQGFASRGSINILGGGRFTSVKRFDRFIWLIHALQNAKIDAKGTLVGQGPAMRELQELDSQLNTKINFAGYVEDMQPFYENCDLFLHTSSNEGMPNVVMEAMYNGNIVAVYPSGDVASLVQHQNSGFIFGDEPEKEMISLAQTLTENKDRAERIRRAAQAAVYQSFRFEDSFSKVRKLIDAD